VISLDIWVSPHQINRKPGAISATAVSVQISQRLESAEQPDRDLQAGKNT
jgi:hypothetical protein